MPAAFCDGCSVGSSVARPVIRRLIDLLKDGDSVATTYQPGKLPLPITWSIARGPGINDTLPADTVTSARGDSICSSLKASQPPSLPSSVCCPIGGLGASPGRWLSRSSAAMLRRLFVGFPMAQLSHITVLPRENIAECSRYAVVVTFDPSVRRLRVRLLVG